jgi:xylan 1,4-beta-xylosidase
MLLATKRDDATLAIAAWNYAPPGESAPPRQLILNLRGLGERRHATIFRLDDDHGSAVTAWREMGKPSFPSREQQELLREAGRIAAPQIRQLPSGDPAALTIRLPPHGLALIEIEN